MAIFGIGATYDKDVSTDFIEQELACVGWDENDAPPAHSILRQLRTGDIIFIKSFAPQVGLTIKAVGLVMEGKVRNNADLGSCVSVKWIWKGEERIGKLNDKWPVRSVTIYEEHHPAVQKKVISVNTTDVVGGGVWGQRPHTISEPTLLVSNRVVMYYITPDTKECNGNFSILRGLRRTAFEEFVTFFDVARNSSWIIFKRVHMLFTDASIILFGFQNIDIRFW